IAMAGARLGRTAVTANLRGGRMMLAIGESQAFSGTLKGTIGVTKLDSGIDLKAQLQFAHVDLETCLCGLFGVRRPDRNGHLAFPIGAWGESVLALARTVNGQANLTAQQGTLAGVNLEQLLRRLERRPLSGTGDFRGGRTPFEKLNLALKITQGNAAVQDVRLEGPAGPPPPRGPAPIPPPGLGPERHPPPGRPHPGPPPR